MAHAFIVMEVIYRLKIKTLTDLIHSQFTDIYLNFCSGLYSTVLIDRVKGNVYMQESGKSKHGLPFEENDCRRCFEIVYLNTKIHVNCCCFYLVPFVT